MISRTMAPAPPKMIAALRCFSVRLRAAMAMTTALSPDRMTLAIMIFHSASQKAAVAICGSTKCINSSPSTQDFHACPATT